MTLIRILMLVLIILLVSIVMYMTVENVAPTAPTTERLSTTTMTTTSGGPRPVTQGYSLCNSTIISKAVTYINEIRSGYGLPPVKYVNASIATYKVKSMMSLAYFGHCNLNGTPYLYDYTKIGGRYFSEENLGVTYVYQGRLTEDPLNLTLDHIWAMVYNDSSSSWGHRDSLLDPTNNYIDLACAYNDKRYFLAIYMVKIWVNWIDPPIYDNQTGIFHASGYIVLENSSLVQVGVYSIEKENVISWPRRAGIAFTCSSLSLGDLYAVVTPHRVTGVKTIIPETYIVDDNYFDVTFHISVEKDRYLVIVFWINNTLPVAHPFDPERYGGGIPILAYTLGP